MRIKGRFGEKRGTSIFKGPMAKVTRKGIKTKSKQKPRQSIEILVNGSSRLQYQKSIHMRKLPQKLIE
jgi:hypothetical protein